jgi:cytochrome c oxidase cbb3-type subunit 3
MADKTQENLMDHEYDGIREYDNPTPAWWHMVFIGTVVFSVVYYVFFQLGNAGWTVEEAYDAAEARDLSARFAEMGELEMNEATVLEYMGEPEGLKVGAAVYEKHCRSCHGDNGEGKEGPNLTDDYYKHVKSPGDILMVVDQGANNGAMPAWGTRLHPNEMVLVASYVANMRGKNLTGGRQADEKGYVVIPAWPEPGEKENPTDPTDRTEPPDPRAAAE